MKEPSNVSAIAGAAAPETVKTVFAQMQKGKINRAQFAEEFNHYLTAGKITGAAKRLKRYGTPRKAEVLSINERGGLEVTTTRLTFSDGELRVLMYRQPSGLIEQFFVSQE